MATIQISNAAELAALDNNLSASAVLTNNVDLSATMMAAPDWATSTNYLQWQVVKDSANQKIYRCLQDHTSGTFADDLAAGKWEYIRDYVPDYSSNSTYSVGDEVIYNSNIYQCVVAVETPEAFDSDKWVQIGTLATGWIPLAYDSNFTGNLNGNGCIISNCFSKYTAGLVIHNGLFYSFGGSAAISNLVLYGFCIDSAGATFPTYGKCGALASMSSTGYSGQITNVHVVKSFIKGYANSSGIIGNTGLPPYFKGFRNCSVNAVITSSYSSGTMAGIFMGAAYNNGAPTVSNCCVSARFVGTNSSQYAAGICTYDSTSYVANVKDCIFAGTFDGTAFSQVAGICCGNAKGPAFFIKNCLNIGSVSSGAAITTCRGISGSADAYTSNSYFLNTFSSSAEDTARARNAEQLRIRSTFNGWNFKRDWYLPADDNWVEKLFPPNDGYPCLRTFSIPSVSGGFGALRGRYNY